MFGDNVECDIHGFDKDVRPFSKLGWLLLTLFLIGFEVLIEKILIRINLAGVFPFGELIDSFDRLRMISFFVIFGSIGVGFDSTVARSLTKMIVIVPRCQTLLNVKRLYLPALFHFIIKYSLLISIFNFLIN